MKPRRSPTRALPRPLHGIRAVWVTAASVWDTCSMVDCSCLMLLADCSTEADCDWACSDTCSTEDMSSSIDALVSSSVDACVCAPEATWSDPGGDLLTGAGDLVGDVDDAQERPLDAARSEQPQDGRHGDGREMMVPITGT